MQNIKDETRKTVTHKQCRHKDCDRAGQELPISEFGVKQDARDGYQTYCKKCVYRVKVEWKLKKKLEAKT